VLAPGDRVPEATVWLAPRESATVTELVQDRSALFFFFLFAWSKSQWERFVLSQETPTLVSGH